MSKYMIQEHEQEREHDPGARVYEYIPTGIKENPTAGVGQGRSEERLGKIDREPTL